MGRGENNSCWGLTTCLYNGLIHQCTHNLYNVVWTACYEEPIHLLNITSCIYNDCMATCTVSQKIQSFPTRLDCDSRLITPCWTKTTLVAGTLQFKPSSYIYLWTSCTYLCRWYTSALPTYVIAITCYKQVSEFCKACYVALLPPPPLDGADFKKSWTHTHTHTHPPARTHARTHWAQIDSHTLDAGMALWNNHNLQIRKVPLLLNA